ncbi:hypothetical protein BOX15_Mlig022144g1 [Macrostomum lignano]|uniref:Trehalase n=1 Tax=Macrostomum lignano TaxID=282301 RepID=A0A267GG88_9PLAT|nr:hypothetical protein BOX15_Mlig022144g1 [Macrostomum lignano]
MQSCLRRRPTRRCTILVTVWSCLAVVLFYLRANRNTNHPKMADLSLSANLLNSHFYWPILDVVQRARIYPDGKQFVDMVLKHPIDEVIKDFELRGLSTKSNKEDIAKFVEDNYLPAGSDVKAVVPPDWQPDSINRLAESLAKEPAMANWVQSLHKLWRSLAKEAILSSSSIPHLSSLIMPSGTDSNWFIVPGGRFRELFYWDTYWTMQGLAVSGMHSTMKSILNIMLAFVTQLGYIPNCNRVYCLNRSQPPMLCLMFETYLKATNDMAFLRENYHLLEREYDWWMSERTSTVVIDYKYSYAMNHYGSTESSRPRPESYREDWETASGSGEPEHIYAELAAACESGQDFSSRWMAKPDSLASVETSHIVPVDLNAIMHRNEQLLSEWAGLLGFKAKMHLYADSAEIRINAIRNVLWNNATGCWFDWHLEKQAPVSNRFYASNLVPLFTGSTHSPETTVPQVLDYLDKSGALVYPAGVPFSLSGNQSHQQWDFPNVWPPYQHMLVTGLANTSNKRARQLARRLATGWLRAGLAAWRRDGVMHEKYDCRLADGGAGSGGEYASQIGFGWTNGAVLDLLSKGLLD